MGAHPLFPADPVQPNDVISYAELVGERFGLQWPPGFEAVLRVKRSQVWTDI